MKLKFTAKASGEGELLLGYASYTGGPKGHLGSPLEAFKLCETPQEFTATMQPRGGVRFIFPLLMVKGKGRAVITDYRMELLK
ncbi:MAG: hypothetical protein PHV59_02915 [Victivallales bacterium]|nr:hypothetical protein [Victivallales bacterium]